MTIMYYLSFTPRISKTMTCVEPSVKPYRRRCGFGNDPWLRFYSVPIRFNNFGCSLWFSSFSLCFQKHFGCSNRPNPATWAAKDLRRDKEMQIKYTILLCRRPRRGRTVLLRRRTNHFYWLAFELDLRNFIE